MQYAAVALFCLYGNETVIHWLAIVYQSPMVVAGAPFIRIITPQQKWNVLVLTIILNQTFALIGLMLTIYLNSILLIDIFLTLRNPFKPYEQRYQIFTFGSVLVAVVVGVFAVGAYYNPYRGGDNFFTDLYLIDDSLAALLYLTTIVAMILIARRINT